MLWTAYLAGGRAAARRGVRPGRRRTRRPCRRRLCSDRAGDAARPQGRAARGVLRARRSASSSATAVTRHAPTSNSAAFPSTRSRRRRSASSRRSRVTERALRASGYSDDEIEASGLFADGRWPGRLCGAWRNEWGRIGTFWARAIDDTEPDGARYLYLRGASRTNLPPYGLRARRARARPRRRLLRPPPAARPWSREQRRDRRHGDEPAPVRAPQPSRRPRGRRSASMPTTPAARRPRARSRTPPAQSRVRASSSPRPLREGSGRTRSRARDRGVAAAAAVPRVRRRLAREGASRRCRQRPLHSPQRREALARAGAWLGSLPPRLALEQEDAVERVAERCGYCARGCDCARFRARFWRLSPRRRDDLAADTASGH